ncbi:MAG TPA: hypothetical protein PK079_18245 [Leptospiraceae bacterium]|nr:hypothetical protein [Leptospiraceae bacterium]HMW08016.1 hypothetical protein [Leptospiraceae bacterium]HMX34699.1 hypothetical protein [Leptospiraceae bacterium]HMY33764.1 hypothetical protein [Leptospiraceae bacterium]HMZ64864.1 hypothetical protein [Leptospiraceae bacterium]
MNKKIILRIAAGLVLFTCLGHTIGIFMPLPPEEVELIKIEDAMKTALVPMPIGKKQSFFDLLLGSNIGLSVYLLVSGISLILISSEEKLQSSNKQILKLESLGLLALSVISIFYFFPIPAICTGIAGILGLYSSLD